MSLKRHFRVSGFFHYVFLLFATLNIGLLTESLARCDRLFYQKLSSRHYQSKDPFDYFSKKERAGLRIAPREYEGLVGFEEKRNPVKPLKDTIKKIERFEERFNLVNTREDQQSLHYFEPFLGRIYNEIQGHSFFNHIRSPVAGEPTFSMLDQSNNRVLSNNKTLKNFRKKDTENSLSLSQVFYDYLRYKRFGWPLFTHPEVRGWSASGEVPKRALKWVLAWNFFSGFEDRSDGFDKVSRIKVSKQDHRILERLPHHIYHEYLEVDPSTLLPGQWVLAPEIGFLGRILRFKARGFVEVASPNPHIAHKVLIHRHRLATEFITTNDGLYNNVQKTVDGNFYLSTLATTRIDLPQSKNENGQTYWNREDFSIIMVMERREGDEALMTRDEEGFLSVSHDFFNGRIRRYYVKKRVY
jgi:hypothetical protein